MFKSVWKQLRNKKGASLIELMLIVGAIALITSFGVSMFRKQANSSGLKFQSNVATAEQNILK